MPAARLVPRGLLALLTVQALCVRALPAATPSTAHRSDSVSLGLAWPEAAASAASAASAEAPPSPGTGPYVRLVARWADVERTPGAYDWTAFADRIRALSGQGDRVVLCVTGANPLHPATADGPVELDPWLGFVRSAVKQLGDALDTIEVWDAPSRDGELRPAFYAFLLKATSVAIRAEAKGDGVAVNVAQGSVRPDRFDWQQGVWDQGTAASIDILPLDLDTSDLASVDGAVRAAYLKVVEHPPASKLFAYVADADPWRGAAAATRALTAGAAAALVALAAEPASAPPPENETPRAVATPEAWIRGVDRILAEGYGTAPIGSLAFLDRNAAPLAGPRVLGRFVHPGDLRILVVYEADRPELADAEGLLVLDIPDATGVQVVDPVTGLVRAGASGTVPDGSGRKAIGVAFRSYPMLVRFKRAATYRTEPTAEESDVSGTRGLTADEIIARHREVQKAQDDTIDRWLAKGRIEFHFKLAQAGSSVDVAIDANYFWKKGAPLEWEQTDYYINGVHANWKDFPEIPFVQPEKVATLPLDLTLDRTYTYRLVGDDRVGGRAAHVLEFEPADPNAPKSLYRGRVWIDRETFEKLRTSLVQTQLDPPVLSNEEVDTYEPIGGPDGPWLLVKTDGQQLWTVAARNLVVARTLTLRDFKINPPAEEFEGMRKQAYSSTNQMLRDTAQGFKYLERQPDGTRIEKDAKSSQWFAAAGAYKDNSIDNVVPLAGVNWFDFDLNQKDLQANVFFAGVFLFGNVTTPHLFGKRIDGAFETALTALKGTDKLYVGDVEQEDQRVESLDEYAALRLGVPWGQFLKVTFSVDITFKNYSRADETSPDFVLPQDHFVLGETLQLEWNRRRTSISVSATANQRSKWEPWGIPAAGGGFPDFEPAQEDFTTVRAGAFHEWFLPKFQKLRVEANYLTGSNLDRFSKFRFGFFGEDRLNGYSGSGVRFDRGAILRGGYAWNLFEVVRFDLALETARVKPDADLGESQNHTGVGISGNFVAPWKTIVNFTYGRALKSDIPELEGQQEFLLVILKLF